MDDHRVLLVGEGNFSFTRSLGYLVDAPSAIDYHLQWTRTSPLRVTGTSYDSYEGLLQRYPDACRMLQAIEKLGFVDVMHGINGWQLHESFDEEFDVVAWNQPHLGVEDFRLHKSLLAHFFHSALKVLRPHGVIVVSLEDRQYHRWGFESAVERQGLTVLAKTLFDPAQFPGYESKRNDNPQSFQNTGTRRHTGSMMSSCVVVVGAGSILVSPTPVSPRPQRDKLEFNCPDCAASYGSAQAVRTHWSQYHKEPIIPQSQMECVLCPGRRFKNEEAYTQHLAARHGRTAKIPLSVAVVAPALPVTDSVCDVCGLPAQTMEAHLQLLLPRLLVNLQCSTCDKTFRDERALKQHENFCNLRCVEALFLDG